MLRMQPLRSVKDLISDQNGSSEGVALLWEVISLGMGYHREFNQSENLGDLLLDLMFMPSKPPPKKIDDSIAKENIINFSKDQGISIEDMQQLFELLGRPQDKNPSQEIFYGRFSSRKVQVFYSALDEETAKAEACYWHSQINKRVVFQKIARRVLFSCEFSGQIKDLQSVCCSKLTQDSNVADGYKFCQELGKEADQEGLHGLLVPSARRQCGTNLPVFLKEALSNLRFEGRFDIVYNPITKSAYAQKLDL